VALRRELLAHRPDFQRVLDLLVDKGDWGKPMPAGKGRGIAIHDSYDSVVGMIAEVAVANGEVKVERVVIACDCGVVVNPRGVETQLEGGMIYGLSARCSARSRSRTAASSRATSTPIRWCASRMRPRPRCISRLLPARNGVASASPARP